MATTWFHTIKGQFTHWLHRFSRTVMATTWLNTIKGQFTQLDIDHMKQVTGGSLDLGSYASTKANGPDVYSKVSSGKMPPGNPWSAQYVANFKAWMDAGYPES